MPILKQFTSGLLLSPPADAISEGFTRSNRGLSPTANSSFRSRFGSEQLSVLNAHSIIYFADFFWYGVGTSLYRAAVDLALSLSGNRLSFTKCPPVAGIVDYLFLAGGGTLYKAKADGTIQNWGIDIPASAPSAAVASGGSLVADAVYQYLITYKNSTTGHRSNSNATPTSATPTGTNLTINLSTIPDGSLVDSQVDKVEIWRTGPDGSLFFYLSEVAAGTTTYSDTGAIDLAAIELPTDNAKPFAYFDDCLGPFNASMFWITRTKAGQRGRLFYSAIGRAEAMQGFIEVTNDTNPLQRIFRFQGQLGVIAENGIFLIGGDNPYVAREVPGCVGTVEPFSVAETPFGVVYRAHDGLRLFDGNTSSLISPGAVDRLFRGESIGDLFAFTSPLTATFARDEYIISDGVQTLAVNKEGRFRDLGIGLSALYYNAETDQIAATSAAKVFDLEKTLTYTDDGEAILIILEPPSINTDSNIEAILQFLTIDLNSNGNQITATLIVDGVTITLGVMQSTSRVKVFFNIGKAGTVFTIRLTGNITSPIEIFSIKPEFYTPA